ncbi:hypothetical protein QTP70_014029 [Hemibagrus guttatus]|uniref:non-specific serine/threonine protein kinase n=1 Tax=Hemibagrus guttatus TaxID=175788 RepID=A0AAE0V5G9_9TELE|nr:hypothetical protein QTP70_014029 [Hemibagrus guttatus]
MLRTMEMPHPDRGPHAHRSRHGNAGVHRIDDNYLSDGDSIIIPGPLMSNKMQMEDLVDFILRKSQECLQHVEQPEQKESYLFWKIMELLCKKKGNVMLAEVAVILFKGYGLVRQKLGVKNQDGWCLPLARLLCANKPKCEHLKSVVNMGEKLDSEELTYAAHICYVIALEELKTCPRSTFELIGCDSLPVSQSAMRDAIERTEVYEYVCSLTSGLAQPNFQIYKCYHATRLAECGLFNQALDYCETIARAIATFPCKITKATLERTIALSERLHKGKRNEPDWLLKLRQLHRDNVFKLEDSEFGLMTGEMLALQFPLGEHRVTSEEEFDSRYTLENLLGEVGFGSVRVGVRKADGKQVAIKHVGKSRYDEFITIPGETQSLPFEVALMKMVSKPFGCENVLELIEWFEMADCYTLVLEQPSPCMDLHEFCKLHNGRLSEPLARQIMHQVVQAARYCCDCGVLHGDIKAENLLINTDTLDVKLKDFGCGDLLKDTPYTRYAGTWAFCPPEWICEGQYLGRPSTVWSLGVLLFNLVCRDLPFDNEDNVYRNMHLAPSLSGDCCDLIWWCLEQDPQSRPTFEEILRHKWFMGLQNKVKDKQQEENRPNYNDRRIV